MIKHLIFDFDGVIADTFDMNWTLCQEHDGEATVEDFLAHHDGNVFEEPRIRFHPDRVHLFYSEYRNRIGASHIEQAVAPIERLAKHYALYIVTSNAEKSVIPVLEQAGILDLFTKIMGAETHRSKYEKFKMLTEQYGVTPENSFFITDTLGDVKEAHRAGIRTIAETFGYHDRARLVQGEPFAIADSWEEIETLVR